MEVVFLGFKQSDSKREFKFESIGADRSRTPVVVVADLSLARRYQIQIQNLPLLCRELLDRSDGEAVAAGTITLNETHMAALNESARVASEEKRSRRSRPAVSSNVGKAWRAPTPFSAAAKWD
jgi:hypothetical protein